MSKLLDITGLTRFWEKVKALLDGKVDADGGTAANLTVTDGLSVSTTDSDGVTTVLTLSAGSGAASTSLTGGGNLLFPYVEEGTSETVAVLSDLDDTTADVSTLQSQVATLQSQVAALQMGTLTLGSTTTAVAEQKSDIETFIANFGHTETFTTMGTTYTVTGVSAMTSSARYIVYVETSADSGGNSTTAVDFALPNAEGAPIFTLIGTDDIAGTDAETLLGTVLRA